VAVTAASTSFSSTTTEIRISEGDHLDVHPGPSAPERAVTPGDCILPPPVTLADPVV
jgi:hypothetical protein